MTDPDAEILDSILSGFDGILPGRLGIAVSGGGDSMALLHVLHRVMPAQRETMQVVTVDHGLRPASADEAQTVASFAAQLGVPHTVLRWRRDGAPRGNLQNAARQARYALIVDWARRLKLPQVALGHTADDQAETVMMRLARASGVDGLSAMAPRRLRDGVTLVRPALGVTRAALRGYLRRNGIDWHDDPSNEDQRFDRIRARRTLEQTAEIGLDAETLAEVAQNMARAREALNWYSFLAAREMADVIGGDLRISLRAYRTLPEETARRLLMRAVMWIGRAEYPLRRGPLLSAMSAIRQARTTTLGGCCILVHDGAVWICREFNAVRDTSAAPGEVWDGRWRLVAPGMPQDAMVAPLGHAGLSMLTDWRRTGRPRAALLAAPALWHAGQLLAVPGLDDGPGCTAELIGGPEEFYASILSH